MKVAVHCIDHPDAIDIRLAHYDEHKAYLAAGKMRTVISGPLLAADGATMIGSL
ncbi:MAG: YciI family protein, partial [Mesorhizobium sp.]